MPQSGVYRKGVNDAQGSGHRQRLRERFLASGSNALAGELDIRVIDHLITTPKEIFSSKTGTFLLTFPFAPTYLDTLQGNENTARKPLPEDPEIRVDGSVKTRVETPVKTPVKTPELILEVFKQQPNLTQVEVVKAIGMSTSAVERACTKLIKAGSLRHLGPAKGGHLGMC